MPVSLKVEFPQQNQVAFLRFLDAKPAEWAEAEALNRAANNASEKGIELVSEEMGISRAKLSKRGRRVNWDRSSKFGAFARGRKANRRRLLVPVYGTGRPFNVKRFKGKPIYAGARTNLKTGKLSNLKRRGKRKQRVIGVQHEAWGRQQVASPAWQLANGAFVTPSGKTFRGIFGPGVTHVLEYPHIEKKLTKHIQERFVHHFGTQIEYAFSRQFYGR